VESPLHHPFSTRQLIHAIFTNHYTGFFPFVNTFFKKVFWLKNSAFMRILGDFDVALSQGVKNFFKIFALRSILFFEKSFCCVNSGEKVRCENMSLTHETQITLKKPPEKAIFVWYSVLFCHKSEPTSDFKRYRDEPTGISTI